MKKITAEIKVRMTPEEADILTGWAKKCGYSREAYIRSQLGGHAPRSVPPVAYHNIMKELHIIGNHLSQIAHNANMLNSADVQWYDDALRLFAEVVARIEEAVILPMRVV